MKKIFLPFVLLLIVCTANALTVSIQSNVTPSTIAPGNSGYLEYIIMNGGTTPVTVDLVSLTADSPITVDTYSKKLGTVAASSSGSAIIKFTVPSSAASGFYSAKAMIKVCNSVCEEHIKYAIIRVQTPSTIEITTDPDSLKPGQNETITFTLKNKGEAVNNIVLTWEDPSSNILPLGSDNRKLISSIGSNSAYPVPVRVVVSPGADQGVYPLSIQISYTDQTGTEQNISSTLGLRIIGDFNFIVSLESQSLVAPGMSGTVDIKVANAGTQEAQFLTINILESDPIIQVKPTIIYVGNVESDDYDTESIGFTAGSASPGNYPLNIEISYKDIYGNNYSDKYAIGVTVSSTEFVAAQNRDYSWLFYIALIVIAYLLYRKFRKKKR